MCRTHITDRRCDHWIAAGHGRRFLCVLGFILSSVRVLSEKLLTPLVSHFPALILSENICPPYYPHSVQAVLSPD